MLTLPFFDQTAANSTPSLRARSFENRLSLPSKWRGVRDAELEEVSGIKGATFVHAGSKKK